MYALAGSVETTSIRDEIIILSASGTAAVVNTDIGLQPLLHATQPETGLKRGESELEAR